MGEIMDRNEFIESLRSSLQGEMPEKQIQENLEYYNDYINQGEAAENSERDIFNELGDPRLIARTILDTYKLSKSTVYQNSEYRSGYEEYNNEEEIGGSANNSSQNIHYGNFGKVPWYRRRIGIVSVLAIVVGLLFLGGFAIRLFVTFVFPILVVGMFLSMIIGLFKKK